MHKEEKLKRLKKACEQGRVDFDDIINQCRQGLAQFFEVENACAVSTISISGKNKVLTIYLAAGTLDGVRELEPIITEYAQVNGCDCIKTLGRPGFSRIFDDIGTGWKPIATVYEKQLRKN